MRTAPHVVVLLAAAWSAGASAGPPLMISGPTTLQPGQTSLFTLATLPPGEYEFHWTATGHPPLTGFGREAAQRYSWATPGLKTLVVDVTLPCGGYVGMGYASVAVQGPPWSGQALAWPQTYYWRVDEVDQGAPQQARVFDTGESGSWSFTGGAPWLAVSPDHGTGAAPVTVTVDASSLPPGPHATAFELVSGTGSQWLHAFVDVLPAAGNQGPFGELTSPAAGATVSGSIAVTGWALDDAGVRHVGIYYADESGPHPPGSGQVFAGDALLVGGSRPDAGTAYPELPHASSAGWGYVLLTNALPRGGNGAFSLYAHVTDGHGRTSVLGPHPVWCDNANAVRPFGAIDAPSPGGEASGSEFANTGWALTPSPGHLATDGSTIDVWVDGINLGHPTYGQYRADVAALFPGYANAPGAGGTFTLDTRRFANGLHTIQWIATDSVANSDGIGSRYFAISNAVANAPSATTGAAARRPPVTPSAASVGPPPWRFEVPTPATALIAVSLADYLPAGSSYSGYTVYGPALGPLPVGATLDPATGAFAWQPGPAFAGTTVLEFWRTSALGEVDSVRLTFELGDVAPIARKLHRPRRALGAASP